MSEAEDGDKAVKNVGRYTPDLIVLDLAMPIMNGLQAAPLLRKVLPAVPIILFTLYAGSALEAKAKAAGITFVMSKETAITELLGKANELLNALT